MRSGLRTGIVATAAVTAAVALYVSLTLPPPTIRLDVSVPPTHVMGAVHMHSIRSDGTGTIEEIASAASRAGLSFIVLTDHGDATRSPDPPAYHHGVLVIDAVEINTREGHLVALGLTEAAPYPLAGAARDVIEDLHRLGAVAVAAHPDSPKESLRWRATNVPVDGVEWLNVDSEWRDESPGRIIGGAFRSLVRPAESIAGLFSRPVASLRRLDQAARSRPVFGLSGLDAHARIGWREDEEPRQRTALARPTYESMFRTLADVVVLDRPLDRQPASDASRVIGALLTGRSYSVVRAFAEPASLTYSAGAQQRVWLPGDRIDQGPSVQFDARAEGAPGARITLFRNGQPLKTGQGAVTATSDEPGVYRVEGYLPGRDMPWLISNPITIAAVAPAVEATAGRGDGPGRFGRGRGGPVTALPQEPRSPVERLAVALDGERWSTEQDPLSRANTLARDGERILAFALGDGVAYGQYTALVLGGQERAGIQELMLRLSASRQMRVSVQVRLPGGRDGQRWQRSVYVDEQARDVTLRLQDFEPVDSPTSRRPIVAPIQSLLFVVDTVNTKPGTTGELRLHAVEFGVNRLQDGEVR